MDMCRPPMDTKSNNPDRPEKNNSWISLFSFASKSDLIILLLALLFSVASGLVIPLMSLLMGWMFHSFALYSNGKIGSEQLLFLVVNDTSYLLILGLAGWLVSSAFFTLWLVFGELQARTAREELFKIVVNKDMEWFDTQKGIAGLISGCQMQIDELKNAVSEPLGFSIQALITASASLGIAFYHSWSLTLVILSGVPVAISILTILSRRTEPLLREQKYYLSSAASTVNRVYTAIQTVKAFNAQSLELQQFSNDLEKSARAYRSQASIVALQIGCIRFITFAMFVQGFWYGGMLVRKENTDAGNIMTTFWSCLMATQSFEMILPQFMLLQKGMAAGSSLKKLTGQVRKEKHDLKRRDIVPDTITGNIQFANVTFAYPSRLSQIALRKIDFSIQANQTTFIIGHSGSGKSTIGNLILRLYEPLSGSITLDGISLSTLCPKWLRENVTFVQQQSILFNETINLNIGLGRKDYGNATQNQIQDACQMAMLSDTISELPLGYDTIAGDCGNRLSGGQCQRIALARARMRDSKILILDEATSNLDYRTRSSVMEAFHEWRTDKTTIIITHDIAQIKPDNFVHVFENGMVIQSGYRKLLESGPGPFQSFMQRSHQNLEVVKINPKTSEELHVPEISWDKYVLETDSHSKTTENWEADTKISNDFMYSEFGNLEVQPPPKQSIHCARHQELLGSQTLLEATVPLLESSRRFTPVHHVKSSLYQIMTTIWPSLTLGYRVLLIFGFMAAMAHGLSTPLFSFTLARLLLSFFDTTNPPSESRKWSLLVLAIAILDGINSYIMHYMLESCGQAWIDYLRIQAFLRILHQPLTWFNENDVSTITGHLEKDAEEMRNLLCRFAGYAFVAVVMTVVGTGWSFSQSWQLTIIGLVIAPVIYGITRGFSWVIGKWQRESNDATDYIGTIFSETISNIRTVRVLLLEEYFRKKYLNAVNISMRIGVKKAIYAGFAFGLNDMTILFTTALIFYSGAYLISIELYNLEEILTVFTLLLFCLANVNAMMGSIPQISNSKETAYRVLHLANLPQGTYTELSGTGLPNFNGPVVFQNVRFQYPTYSAATAVICNLNLTISPGKCTAIVGPSGSGKSTLTALLQRFYNPISGAISLSSDPLLSLNIQTLRSHISLVPQSAVLFPATIHENIAYGGTYSRHAVEQAACSAGIHDFIDGLPQKYDTYLMNGGSSLSGGQAQRIAIARALIRPSTLLIFDECTSNLDPESARVVYDTIKEIMQQERRRTVILITHSQEMMKCADRIVVLRNGEVVEEGVYSELLKENGELSRLLMSQQ